MGVAFIWMLAGMMWFGGVWTIYAILRMMSPEAFGGRDRLIAAAKRLDAHAKELVDWDVGDDHETATQMKNIARDLRRIAVY